MSKIEAVPKPTSPKFMGVVVVQIQDILKTELPWLDYSFGGCQKLINKDSKKFYPAVHIGHGKYVSVFPDMTLGNFSFMSFEDPQTIDHSLRPHMKVTQKFSLIFWFNMDKVFGKQKDRSMEEIKLEILTVINTKMFLDMGRITMSEIKKDAKNIYAGYDIDEVASQFLMQPFGGLRFEGTIECTQIIC